MGKKGVRSWELGVGEEEIEKLDNYQLSTLFPHLPTSPSPHPLPHSAHRYAEAKATALYTQHSLPTRNSELGTLFPTQHSALYTQHSGKH
uniref:Uncharacterized protein n=1 Tax=Desertifilum tharense IPPAS B-1220 TaxID=1781255 RepID=A0ACD5GNP7_9CYAN